MKNYLFEISEEEKNKILEMHKIATKNQYLSEQTVSGSYQAGVKSGQAAGQKAQAAIASGVNQAKTAVATGTNTIIQGAKVAIVTFMKISFKVVIYGGAIIFLIGKGVFKVQQIIGNAILKFIVATKNGTVSAYNAADQAVSNFIWQNWQGAKAAFNKNAESFKTFVSSQADQGLVVFKWIMNSLKSLGVTAYAKYLLLASQAKELSQIAGNWIKEQYNSISRQVGASWDDAMNTIKSGAANLKQSVTKGAADLKQSATKAGTDFLKGAASTIGQAKGFVSGLFEEVQLFLEIYNSFSNDTLTLISEANNFSRKLKI